MVESDAPLVAPISTDASTGAPKAGGLVLARGNFDLGRIATFAQQNGAVSSLYAGVTIWQEPKKTAGVAFVDNTLAVIGDVESVKAALDRRSARTSLPAALLNQVAEWSLQDAWVVGTVPAGSFASLPKGLPQQLGQQPSVQSIKQGAAGVKFGSSVVITARAEADTAQNATAMAGALQFIANLVQMQTQSSQAGNAAALLRTLLVTTLGNTVTISWSVPQDQLQMLMQPKPATARPAKPAANVRVVPRRPATQL